MGVVADSTDGTHFCEKGANIVAGLVAGEIRKQNISGLASCPLPTDSSISRLLRA